MKTLLTKFALWHRHTNPRFAQSGFGIIEALVVLLLIAGAAAGLGRFFLSSKDMVLNQQARLAFEEDLLRLMMITEENSVCEHLNLVSSGFKLQPGSQVAIGKIPVLEFDQVTMAKVGKDRRYGIKSIELIQLSREYGTNPRRARGSIVIVPEFYEKDGITVKKGSKLPTRGNIDVIIAADPGGLITSCYGTFSRKISCLDGNGTFNPEATPNCQF